MSDHLLVRAPDEPVLALLSPRALAGEDERRKAITRGIAATAVVVLHLVLLLIFVVSESVPIPLRAVPREIQLIIPPLSRPAPPPAPPLINARPVPITVPKVIEPLPITPQVSPEQAEVNALRALGQALACGASRYEYLSPVERKLCKHAPWKMPSTKTIVIAPPPPVAKGIMTGAEAEDRFRRTAHPCPILQTTPCNDEIINGKAPH